MEQTLFRSATPADVPRILQIIRQAQRRMAAAGSLQWQDGYPAPGNIDDDLKHRYVHVITREGASGEPTVIAYGAIVFDGEPAYEALDGAWLTRGDYVVVHRLAVADEALGHGVGREFLRQTELLASARGIGAFRIDTNYDNMRMLRILAQTGFVRCGSCRTSFAAELTMRAGGLPAGERSFYRQRRERKNMNTSLTWKRCITASSN